MTAPPLAEPTLWDRSEAQAARDDAVRAVAASEAPWVAVAFDALCAVARRQPTLSSEDVWVETERMGIPRPVEARAMGPVMKRGVRDGVIRLAGFTTGTDPRHHSDILRTYRSELYR